MMKKRMWLPLVLAVAMVAAAGCAGQEAAPPVSDPAGSDPSAATGGAATENDIAPAPDQDAAENAVKKTVTFLYADKELMAMYRVDQEVEAASEEELPLAALKLWLEGPEHEKLQSLVPPDVVIESLEFQDDLAVVSFSSELKNANLGSTGEVYLIDQIAQLMNEFGYGQTQILIEGKKEESILGHISTDVPITPVDPEQYERL